jgi:2-oxoglutarate/2-oxoacid ferredoxin oxidoreductase subunit alpha
MELMRRELTIRIAGEAGQGMQTVGFALCKLAKKAGLYLFANQDYMSRIRGGNNFFQLRISSGPIYTLRKAADIIVALDRPSVDIHKKSSSKQGIMVLDRKKFNMNETDKVFFDVPLYKMAQDIGGSELFVNSVALGVLAEITGAKIDYVNEVLRDIFSDKSAEIIQKNIDAAKAGFDFSKNNLKQDRFELKEGSFKQSLLMNGNDAIALGAIKAGCKFYSAYPMTPSTSIMNNMAHFAKGFNIVVEQAEDEIAAINMIIGSSFAGCRSMAATSGGGFALMVEGLSLAGMTETPIVIVEAQRPAPATGFPTRTEQADLNFLTFAGHGEFARAVFSPGTIEQCFYLTVKAFNLAEKYQIPVLIMTDQHLADSYLNINEFKADKIKVSRYIISKEDSKNISGYKRYQFTGTGISPRAIPSWINDVIYADSDEHTEEGHITEDAAIRKKMVEKRFYKKMAGLLKEVEKPYSYNLKEAKILLVGFGSNYGVMREVCEASKDKKIGLVHLPQVWPFPADDISKLLKAKRNVFTVENNAGAQLAGLIRSQTGIKVQGSILKYDGRPFDLDYLLDKVKNGI